MTERTIPRLSEFQQKTVDLIMQILLAVPEDERAEVISALPLSPPPPPGDMVLLPREPTLAILCAGFNVNTGLHYNSLSGPHIRGWTNIYKAMLAASPLPTQEVSEAMVERVARAMDTVTTGPDAGEIVISEMFSPDLWHQMSERLARAAIESALRTGERKE